MITKPKPLTIADWDAMPYGNGKRYEIIEGELFVSCSPGLTHQIVCDNLNFLIRNFLETNPIGLSSRNLPIRRMRVANTISCVSPGEQDTNSSPSIIS